MKKNAYIRLYVFGTLAFLLLLTAACGRWLAPWDPLLTDYSMSLKPPDAMHLCGTDKLGRDIWSRILCGASGSFFLTFFMVFLTSATGTLIGMWSGFCGGRTDTLVMRSADILLAFPDSVFAIAVAGMLGAGLFHTVFALSLVWWTKYARMTRNMTMEVKKKDFIAAARFGGAGSWRIVWKYIVPNILPQIVVMAALDIGGMMMALAGLSFLGLASQPPAPEWGYMLYESRQYMQTAPWMMIYPGLALLVTVIVFNLLGDSLRDLLDPRR